MGFTQWSSPPSPDPGDPGVWYSAGVPRTGTCHVSARHTEGLGALHGNYTALTWDLHGLLTVISVLWNPSLISAWEQDHAKT